MPVYCLRAVDVRPVVAEPSGKIRVPRDTTSRRKTARKLREVGKLRSMRVARGEYTWELFACRQGSTPEMAMANLSQEILERGATTSRFELWVPGFATRDRVLAVIWPDRVRDVKPKPDGWVRDPVSTSSRCVVQLAGRLEK